MSKYTTLLEKENAELRKQRDELLSIFNAKFENDENLSIEVIFDKLGELMPNCALADYLERAIDELSEVEQERDALQARIDGGIRVHAYASKVLTQSGGHKRVFYVAPDRRSNATLIIDEGVTL
jgi:hypothetical protein